jgi:hypothetical protein
MSGKAGDDLAENCRFPPFQIGGDPLMQPGESGIEAVVENLLIWQEILTDCFETPGIKSAFPAKELGRAHVR